jgi:hypothetical protein
VAALPPAARAPQKLAGVVMQKVPVDPLAGPVAHKNVAAPKTAVAHNQAAASKTKLAAVKLRTPDAAAPAKGPVLRTAADNQ